MRDLTTLDKYRRTRLELDYYAAIGGAGEGVFHLPHASTGVVLQCIASSGEGWDHVSVSIPRAKRCPNWPEMSRVAQTFFAYDETAMQLHVPATEHVNCHPYTLHWWRPQAVPIPRPPILFV